jgi:hypothetical protein
MLTAPVPSGKPLLPFPQPDDNVTDTTITPTVGDLPQPENALIPEPLP